MSEDLRYYFFDHEADDHPSIPSEEGWKQMQQLLDKELPLSAKRRPRRYLFFGIAAVTGLIFLATSVPLKNYFDQKNKMLPPNRDLVITATNNKATETDTHIKITGQSKAGISGYLTLLTERSLELQSIQELSKSVEQSQNQAAKKDNEDIDINKSSSEILPGIQAIDTFKNSVVTKVADTKDETTNDNTKKKKAPNSNYKKWQLNAGIASNVSFNNTLHALQPYPFTELKYHFSPLFFAGTSVGLFSPVGSNANGVKKTVYINDMSINVSNYAEKLYYTRLSYADVSLTAGAKFNDHLSIQSGIQFSRLLSSNTKTSVEPYDFDMNLVRIQQIDSLQPTPSAAPVYNKKIEPRKFDIRYVAGINYDLKKISLGLQYQAGINNTLKGDAVSADKNKMITLRATYRFK